MRISKIIDEVKREVFTLTYKRVLQKYQVYSVKLWLSIYWTVHFFLFKNIPYRNFEEPSDPGNSKKSYIFYFQ